MWALPKLTENSMLYEIFKEEEIQGAEGSGKKGKKHMQNVFCVRIIK